MSFRWSARCTVPLLLVLQLALLPGCAGRHYQKGHEAMDEGDAATAVHHYQKAARKKPKSADYQFALGQAYVRDGIYPKAVEALSKANTLEPERIDVLDQLAFSMVKVGNTADAVDAYGKLFVLQEYPFSTFEKMRPLLESQGRHPEVVEAALLSSRQPKFEANRLSDIAKEYYRAGKLKEAEKLYRRALEIKPRQAVVWRTLGEIRLALDDGKGAAEAFEQAYTLDPSDSASAIGSAAALRRMGQIVRAIQIYERVVGADPDRIDAYAALVELYLAVGRVDEAEVSAREVFIRSPEDPGGLALKGAVSMAKGEYDKAIQLLERASLGALERRAWVLPMLGNAYLTKGERTAARGCFTRALSHNAEDGAALLGLCRLDLESGREELGMDRCKKSMMYAPELRDEALLLMQLFYEQQGRLQLADELEKSAPPPADMPTRRKKTSEQAGEGASKSGAPTRTRKEQLADLQGLKEMLLAIDDANRSPREWYELGEVSWKLNDLETAERAYSQAWKAEPDNATYHLRLALALLARNHYDAAVVHLKDIVRDDERDVSARFGLAEAYLARGSASDSLEVLKELKELAPGNARVYQLMADAYLELGLQAEAEKSQRLALEAGKRK